MNHRPFEDWLLEDEPLSAQEERDLQIHLRTCESCSAIADSNLALRSARLMSAPDGFAERFKGRLAAWRARQKLYQLLGTLVLVIGGLAALYVVAGAIIQDLLDSPAALITSAAAYFVFFVSSAHVIREIGGILVSALQGFMPPAGWLLMAMLGGGMGVIWVRSMRRLARAPEGF
jgi:hypothetical protein